jgi:predicted PurR-regulated permease PerM
MSKTSESPKANLTLIYLAAFVIVMAGVIHIQSIINPLLMALFISIVFSLPLDWLKRKKVPHGLALAIAIGFILALYVGLFQLISSSLSLFIAEMPKYEGQIKSLIESVNTFLSSRGVDASQFKIAEALGPAGIMKYTASVFGELSGVMSHEITFLFLSIFLLAESESTSLKFKVVEKYRATSLKHFDAIGSSIRHYLSIKTVTSLATGVLIATCLAIIGVDFPILWGFLAFLLNFIPNIGSIIASIPAILFALLQLGIPGAIWTGGVFVVVNMVVGNVVEPRMMGKGLGLSTLVVFFALIFWGYFLGIVGMFLSVPIMMVIKILLDQNPNTRWISILLGTQEESELALKEENNSNQDTGD